MAAVFDTADAPPQPARRPGQGRAELGDAELLDRLRAIDEGLAGRLHAAAVECAAGLPLGLAGASPVEQRCRVASDCDCDGLVQAGLHAAALSPRLSNAGPRG